MKKNYTLMAAASIALASGWAIWADAPGFNAVHPSAVRITSDFTPAPKEALKEASEPNCTPGALLDGTGREIARQQSAVMKAPAKAQKVQAPAGTPLPALVVSVVDNPVDMSGFDDDFTNATGSMYRLPDVTGGEMTLEKEGVYSNMGATLGGGVYYASPDGRKLIGYNPDTWEVTRSAFTPEYYNCPDIAYDPVSGELLGYLDQGTVSFYYSSINPSNGVTTQIGSFEFNERVCRALTFSPEGVLYGIRRDGKLVTLNPASGAQTILFDLPITNQDGYHSWSAVWDDISGLIYFLFNDSSENAYLYSVDPQNGTMTELISFGHKNVTGMFIQADKADANAPAAATNVTGSFPAGALTGTLTFTLPDKLFGGADATGTLTWTVKDNNTTLATGTGNPGATVTADVTLDAAGQHTLTVTVSNATGDSPRAKFSQWFGPDTPKAPKEAKSVFDEATNTFTVSWQAVTAGEHSGYVDPAAVTYTVSRLPENEQVATGLTATTFSEVFAAESLRGVSYAVTANYAGNTSEAAVTGSVTVGSLLPPYTQDFSSRDNVASWTISDENADGKTWSYSSYGPAGFQYSYNYSLDADDWLFTPPISVESGCRYPVKLKIQTRSDIETFEVKFGTSPDAASMTNVVLSPTEITSNGHTTDFDLTLSPQEAGRIYIGIHAISPANKWMLAVAGFEIGAAVPLSAPKPVTNLIVTPDAQAQLKATVTLTAPTEDTTDGALASITKIEVYRGDVLAKTFENVAAGSQLSFEDEVPASDPYTYTAYAFNGTARSEGTSTNTFIGINEPSVPTNAKAVEDGTSGRVTITWDAPATDVDGYPICPDVVKYRIRVYRNNNEYHPSETIEDITSTSYTFTPDLGEGNTQAFLHFDVAAYNERGSNWHGAFTDNIPVGEPCTAPFKESFPEGALEHNWGDGETNFYNLVSVTIPSSSVIQDYNGWNRVTDTSFTTADGAQDGDNGFLAMFGYAYDDDRYPNGRLEEYHYLNSDKIDLTETQNPILSYYLWNWVAADRDCPNTMEVYAECEGERTLLDTRVCRDFGTQGWHHVIVPLDQYAGKVVRLLFKGTVVDNFNWVMIDNISVHGTVLTDLAVASVEAPVKAAPAEEFTVSALVENLGRNGVDAFTATLLHNGNEVETRQCDALGFGKNVKVDFTTRLSSADPVTNIYTVRVDAEGDADTANNLSEEVVVARSSATLPVPRNVGRTDSSISWEEPDMTTVAPNPVTEDFEACEPFTTVAGDWVFVDRDNAPIGGIMRYDTDQNLVYIELPNIELHSVQSWWVQNANYSYFNDTYYAHSGYQYICNMYNYDGEGTVTAEDDWAISPELYGGEQMVSFFARSYSKASLETFEVLWSDGSTNPDDFTRLAEFRDISVGWTEFVVILPEGARRFAIRGTSYDPVNGNYQTFVDDVTYVPAEGERPELHLLGYNVYSSEKRLNEAPVTDLSLALDEIAEPSDLYYVSAVYTEGESATVPAVFTALGTIEADSDAPAVYYNLQGQRIAAPLPGTPCIELRGTTARKLLR